MRYIYGVNSEWSVAISSRSSVMVNCPVASYELCFEGTVDVLYSCSKIPINDDEFHFCALTQELVQKEIPDS